MITPRPLAAAEPPSDNDPDGQAPQSTAADPGPGVWEKTKQTSGEARESTRKASAEAREGGKDLGKDQGTCTSG